MEGVKLPFLFLKNTEQIFILFLTQPNVCDTMKKLSNKEVIFVKFVHIADVHFDSPFEYLSQTGHLGDVRRLEQRNIFRKIIDYIQEHEIDYLLIAGDLYEHQYVRKTTMEYVRDLLTEIVDTEVFIVPGNHDPYVKNSFYDKIEWSQNVHICKKETEVFCGEKLDIYMTAFTDFYQNDSPIEKIEIKNPNKDNLLLTHCDLNGTRDKNRIFI